MSLKIFCNNSSLQFLVAEPLVDVDVPLTFDTDNGQYIQSNGALGSTGAGAKGFHVTGLISMSNYDGYNKVVYDGYGYTAAGSYAVCFYNSSQQKIGGLQFVSTTNMAYTNHEVLTGDIPSGTAYIRCSSCGGDANATQIPLTKLTLKA